MGWVHFLGLSVGAVSAAITGLNPSSTFFYRFFATNSYGSAWGNPAAQFVTFPNTPLITNGAATAVGALTATFNGTLTSTGSAPTTVTVYYGTVDQGRKRRTVGLGLRAFRVNRSALSSLPSLVSTPPRPTTIVSLPPIPTGHAWGDPTGEGVTSPNTPLITNGAATGVTDTNAMLNGDLTWVGSAATTVIVYYGTVDRGATGWEGSQEPAVKQAGAVSATVAGLTFLHEILLPVLCHQFLRRRVGLPASRLSPRVGAPTGGGQSQNHIQRVQSD